LIDDSNFWTNKLAPPPTTSILDIMRELSSHVQLIFHKLIHSLQNTYSTLIVHYVSETKIRFSVIFDEMGIFSRNYPRPTLYYIKPFWQI